eukprot:6130469-Prymnesium_polylepis.1
MQAIVEPPPHAVARVESLLAPRAAHVIEPDAPRADAVVCLRPHRACGRAARARDHARAAREWRRVRAHVRAYARTCVRSTHIAARGSLRPPLSVCCASPTGAPPAR